MGEIDPLLPRWMESAGAMLGTGALVRSRCCRCGTELRVELADLVARHGPTASLIDRLERCRVVGCTGSSYYLAARTYDRPWTVMVRDPGLIETVVAVTPPRAAAAR